MIYFIQNETKTGPIKIGYTERDIYQRLKTLQIGNPNKLIILSLIEGDKIMEQKIHKRFDYLREFGEWFLLDTALDSFISETPSVSMPAPDIPLSSNTTSLPEILESIEKEYIRTSLLKNRGNKFKTSLELGISYRSLRYRIDVLKIEKP